MIAESFIDTNVLIYAAAGAVEYREKHAKAWEIMSEAKHGLSGQVLAEFYVNTTRPKSKLAEPLTKAEAADWVERLGTVPIVAIDRELVTVAIAHSRRFQINYWDAALIAAAERLEVPVLYSEDLNHGQKYGSVTVINPFKAGAV
jgi:predicted nucleic acid-binding protein